MNRKLKFLHVIPIRRSAEGKVLGVFRGLAEHVGFSVCWTRVLGVLVLLGFGDTGERLGINLVIGGVGVYVLLALLMWPPASVAPAGAIGAVPVNGFGHRESAVFGGTSGRRPAYPVGQTAPTVDLASLERQLDRLSRRIAQMENIVVTREADWDRRLGKG